MEDNSLIGYIILVVSVVLLFWGMFFWVDHEK